MQARLLGVHAPARCWRRPGAGSQRRPPAPPSQAPAPQSAPALGVSGEGCSVMRQQGGVACTPCHALASHQSCRHFSLPATCYPHSQHRPCTFSSWRRGMTSAPARTRSIAAWNCGGSTFSSYGRRKEQEQAGLGDPRGRRSRQRAGSAAWASTGTGTHPAAAASPCLYGQHLSQLERRAAHTAQCVGQPLCVVLGHEGGVGAALRGVGEARRHVG